MILVDTDILSAMAKIGRIQLFFALLQTPQLHLTPGVFGELAHSFNLGRQYAVDVFALIAAGQLQIVYLTQEEAAFRDTLPVTLGAGERESIAIARARGGTVLSNESRVAHHCRTHEVSCVRLPDILRALWVEGIVSQQAVQEIIHRLADQGSDAVYTIHPSCYLRRVKPLLACTGHTSWSNDSLPQVIALPVLVIVPLHGDVQQLL